MIDAVRYTEQKNDGENGDGEEDPYKKLLVQMQKERMISPNSPFRGRWDLTQAILLVYIAVRSFNHTAAEQPQNVPSSPPLTLTGCCYAKVLVPYRIGFSLSVPLWSPTFFFEAAIDVFFITDLFVTLAKGDAVNSFPHNCQQLLKSVLDAPC